MQVNNPKFRACILYVIVIIGALLPSFSFAQFSDSHFNGSLDTVVIAEDSRLQTLTASEALNVPLTFRIHNNVADQREGYPYAGMAGYLGAALPIEVSNQGRVKVLKPKLDKPVQTDGEWVGYRGRFNAVLLRSETGSISVDDDILTVSWPAGVIPDLKVIQGSMRSDVTPMFNLPELRNLKYAHLPKWLRALCRFVEWVYRSIQVVTGFNWGLSLLIFAIVMKLVLLPAAILTRRFQAQTNRHKAALEPIFNDIKKSYKGETAHKKIMAAYKARGITPYYTLKPFLATMISLPFLIAIFNMLGEIQLLKGASFLWFESLAYPDRLFQLPLTLPWFGSSFNLLPFIMTGVTCLSALRLKSASASPLELKRQKRNFYLMGGAFFFLFYPFPSAMVLYWTLSTALQFVINIFMKDEKTT